MTSRSCPICRADSGAAKIFLEENINPSLMSKFSFASRKMPEFMCHRLVQCPICDLVYAPDPPDQSVLAEQYHQSDFDSNQEANDAAIAYGAAILPVLNKLENKNSALEIGAGTGVFLDVLKKNGFKELVGVEPSSAAIQAAPAHRKSWILESIFRESDFHAASFDLICCFMTMEHVRDPDEIVSAASRLLRPGGALVLITHDYRSLVNRLLGRRSPIIDIEHMQLFSKKSILKLLDANNFVNSRAESFFNSYALRYWIRLLPVSQSLKKNMTKFFSAVGLAEIRIKANVGNIISYGFISNR